MLRANSVLRALEVPAGKHVIEFKFQPKVFFLGRTISDISVWVLMALLAGCIVYYAMKWKKRKDKN